MNEKRYSPFIVALANQAICSLTNFFFLLYLVRVLDSIEFGYYSIAFAVLLGAGAVLQGLFLVQMITQLPVWEKTGRTYLVSAVLVLQILVCMFLGFAITVGTYFLLGYTKITICTLLTAAAITTHAIKEFLVRYFFATKNKYIAVVCVNGMLAFTLCLTVIFGPECWTSNTAIFAFFLAHFTAAVLALVLAKLPLYEMRLTYLREAAAAIAPGGYWASVSALIYTARASAHTFIVALMVGPADVGRMNAARVLVTPATIIIPSLSNVILPEMVLVATADGAPRVYPLAVKASGVIFSITLLYSAVLMMVWELAQIHVLGDTYRDSRNIVALWCLYAMAISIRSGMEWGLQALKKFRLIARINIIGSSITIVAVAILTYFCGILGAINGALIGEAITALAAIVVMRRITKVTQLKLK